MIEVPSRLRDERMQALILFVGLLGIVALAVSHALVPSHYGVALANLGVDPQTLFGTARGIRADEWAALTPLFQTAVLGEFAPTNTISPYGEPLLGFWAVPILDWSLVFKPQLWGFWVLPPAYAYALYFALLAMSFLVGYTILLRQLGVGLLIAAAASVCLFASHYVQVWWGSNAPVFALAPWPVIVLLTRWSLSVKAILAAYAACVWVFGLVYPPFVIGAAFAFLILILAFRLDAVNRRNIIAAGLAIAAFGVAFLAYYGDLIEIMRQTEYPGARRMGLDTLTPLVFLAHVFPFLYIADFKPLLSGFNECEIAVVATLLPLAALFVTRPTAWVGVGTVHWRAVAVVALGLAMMAAWMLLSVPPSVGAPLLWNHVPAHRMTWGFGLLGFLALVCFLARMEMALTAARVRNLALALVAIWLVGKTVFALGVPSLGAAIQLYTRSLLELLPALILAGLAAAIYVWPQLFRAPHAVLVGIVALCGVVTFGQFNPVQPAHPIFAKLSSDKIEAYRAQQQANPNGWLVVEGYNGAVFSGLGIPAINHTLTRPQPAFFRDLFPDMPEAEFNRVFNRYAHVAPAAGLERPHNPSADVIQVPLEAFQ